MKKLTSKNPVKIEDLFKIKMVSDPQISPDGKKALFVHTIMDLEKNDYLSDIWIANLEKRIVLVEPSTYLSIVY